MAEIPTPPGGPRYFSIVIAGTMTPSIHHPLWYHLIGCLTKAETDAAVLQTTIASNMAQFQTAGDGGIRITCDSARWEAAVWKEEDRPRILEIASKVFEKLTETPVNAYAFFSMADLDTKVSRTREILADLATSTGLGFETGGDRDCAFHFSNQQPAHAVNVIIRHSEVHDSKVWVSYSTQHAIKPISGYYALGPDLTKDFDPHWEAAKAMGSRAVARVNQAGATHAN